MSRIVQKIGSATKLNIPTYRVTLLGVPADRLSGQPGNFMLYDDGFLQFLCFSDQGDRLFLICSIVQVGTTVLFRFKLFVIMVVVQEIMSRDIKPTK